ncbi:MAG: hypothetical protein FWG16_00050 [Micrococcales bacterium]|nr:hypothetical protein [Micrococcales bacterium]
MNQTEQPNGGFDWPKVGDAARRLLIGPVNFAGQGEAWAQAVNHHLSEVQAVSFGLEAANRFDFPASRVVPQATYRNDKTWQQAHFEWVTSHFSHVLIEAFRPLFGGLFHFDPFKEAKLLGQMGVQVAFVAHGSEVRVPSRHAKQQAASPFASGQYPGQRNLERRSRRHVAVANQAGLPIFVSTPDLVEYLPAGRWLPIVVDPERWANQASVMARPTPVVLHAPSDMLMKGTDLVRPQLTELEKKGLIEYRELTEVPADDLPGAMAEADLVLDQFRVASYGVAAVEAMAAGRAVIGNVSQLVRQAAFGLAGQELPIWEAQPDSIGRAVMDLVNQPDKAVALAAGGSQFAQKVHNGAQSAAVLKAFLER